jgi:hypothetical protein
MESTRFDALSRTLATAGARRRVLGFLAGLPLAVGLTSGGEAAARGRKKGRQQDRKRGRDAGEERHKKHKGCIPTGKRCPGKKSKGKKGKRLRCKDCCQGSFTTNSSGAKVCACQPEGTACTADTASNCCSGVCTGGTCQATNGCAAECNGCCDASGACQAGTTAEVCGADGVTCSACSGDTPICRKGVCSGCKNLSQCPANSVCAASGACLACDVCANGCVLTSIQGAIDGRPYQDVFAICRGTYTGNLALERDVELIGARDGFTMLTIVRGDGTASVITIPDAGQDVTLSQITITNGSASNGGGILHEGKALTMGDVVVTGNGANGTGAGLSAPGGSPARSVDMTRCTIEFNSVTGPGVDGGGVFNGSTKTMRDCEITYNSASGRGGGIFNEGTLTLHSTAVGPQNGSSTLSGGIYNTGTLALHASQVGPQNYRGGIENAAPGTVALNDGSVVCGNFGSVQCTGFTDPSCQTTCRS